MVSYTTVLRLAGSVVFHYKVNININIYIYIYISCSAAISQQVRNYRILLPIKDVDTTGSQVINATYNIIKQAGH